MGEKLGWNKATEWRKHRARRTKKVRLAMVPLAASERSPMPPLIHPTAVISPEAVLAADTRVGPYAVIEGPVTVGSSCVIGAHTHLSGPLTIGRDNTFGTGAVIGEKVIVSEYC